MQFESILPPSVSEKRPFIIAGPCSAETRRQVMQTARLLKAQGITVFRAGVWKPRTKPGGFEGVGTPALRWMKEAKKETGVYISTEVASAKHVSECLKHRFDMLWLGARTVANPFAVQEIADALRGADIPVLIKNPVNPDIELWIGAIERLYNAGLRKLGVIHRGFSSFDKSLYRNAPQWHIPIELKRRYPSLPILCDPSHIGGRRDAIATLSQQAMDLEFYGLMIETHCHPDEAWSDKEQQITPQKLSEIRASLIIRDKMEAAEGLSAFRAQIDELDTTLLQTLAKRMAISRQIGVYKSTHAMPILQTERYDTLLASRSRQAGEMELKPDFVKKILEFIHEESVREQMEVMREK